MRLRQLTNLVGIPLIILFIIGAIIEVSPRREEGQTRHEELPPLVSEQAYAVSAAHPAAVQVGMDIMKQGGNAIDAAIAVSFMLGVVEPYGSGIGGGGSMLIYDPHQDQANQMQYVDYRETAPNDLITLSMIQEGELGALEAEIEEDPIDEGEEDIHIVEPAPNPNPLTGTEDEESEATEEESLESREKPDLVEEEMPPELTEFDVNREQMKDFGVPGFLKGMAHLHNNHGSLSLDELIQPSIEMAREGFAADIYLVDRFFYAQNRIYHADLPHFFPEDYFIREGQMLIQEELATTMEEIRDLGPERYFHDVLAPDMSERYPLMDVDDFEEYAVWEETNIPTGTYRGYQVYAAPPPLGGPVLIQALYMAEKIGLDAYQFQSPTEGEPFYAGWEVEDVNEYADFMVDLLGINDRTYRQRLSDIGDPNTSEQAREKMAEIYERDYASQMVMDWYEDLEKLQDEFLPNTGEDNLELEEGTEAFHHQKETDGNIASFVYGNTETEGVPTNEKRLSQVKAAGQQHPHFDAESELNEHNNTTHFVIIDKDGRMVSATHTLSNFFGSGEYYKGFFLNDQLSNFSQTPGSINEPLPGRRPRSFMTPAILINETAGHVEEVIGVGSPGGARIPNMIAQALIYFGLHGMEFDEAVDMLRFQYAFNEDTKEFEIRLESAYQNMDMLPFLQQNLNERGFRTRIEHGNMYFGGIQALILNVREGIIDGNADPRRGGKWDRAEFEGEGVEE